MTLCFLVYTCVSLSMPLVLKLVLLPLDVYILWFVTHSMYGLMEPMCCCVDIRSYRIIAVAIDPAGSQ